MANNAQESRAVTTVTQNLADFGVKVGDDGKLIRLDGSRIKTHAAYKEWLYRLRPGERLPRGRFFRGKRPGRPLVIMDEFHNFI
ncbi:hypothetical protein [Klebsiella quasipneumoniae]|uniref:hypothetical protein n=1 Tax=Klebsiella quasipneumoniae TaxID=1463165 RepID=UPI001C94D001|nr:hypothetical protein [Klebsiella quasipneumoniae]MBY5246604.1 hypothetical protein [Klebsiella quasipneumoniae]